MVSSLLVVPLASLTSNTMFVLHISLCAKEREHHNAQTVVSPPTLPHMASPTPSCFSYSFWGECLCSVTAFCAKTIMTMPWEWIIDKEHKSWFSKAMKVRKPNACGPVEWQVSLPHLNVQPKAPQQKRNVQQVHLAFVVMARTVPWPCPGGSTGADDSMVNNKKFNCPSMTEKLAVDASTLNWCRAFHNIWTVQEHLDFWHDHDKITNPHRKRFFWCWGHFHEMKTRMR